MKNVKNNFYEKTRLVFQSRVKYCISRDFLITYSMCRWVLFTAQKMRFSIKDFFTFTEEIFNVKLNFYCSDFQSQHKKDIVKLNRGTREKNWEFGANILSEWTLSYKHWRFLLVPRHLQSKLILFATALS